MVDTFAATPDMSTGIVNPVLQAAYASDPRVTLARLMAPSLQEMAAAPAYNTSGAIAKGLVNAVPAITQMLVGREYQQRQADLGDTMKRALAAGESGIPAQTDENGNVTTPAVQPGYEALAKVLTQSSDPAAQQMGMQFGVQGLATQQAARLSLLQKLAEQHLTLDANNQVVPMPGAGQAAADVAKPTKQMEAGVATQQAIETAKGTAPIEVGKAVQIEAGKAPIDTFKELFKPVVNRVTGEVSIPGVDDPKMVNTIMQRFGVTSKDLGGAATPPQAAAPPPVATAAGTSTSASAPPAVSKGPVPAGTVKPIDEVPSVPLPTGEMARSAGTIAAGRDPIKIKAAEEAVTQATEQYKATADTAKAANAVHAQLGTMRATLAKGGINTNATAPTRATISAYLNATLGPDTAKQVTGIDPAQADVFNKDATRMGLTFARQTEGAREAVAAIKIALGANPSLANTMEGNKKIIDLLDAGAQHDIDAQKYSDAFFKKNEHYVGAQEWFNQNHPPAEYTSRVIPYVLPRAGSGGVDVSKLQPNVTYQGKSGAGVWNGEGFVPVQ